MTAETCGKIDLQERVPIPLWAKARDQEWAPWCGAFAVSNSVSFEIGEGISALFLASTQEKIMRRSVDSSIAYNEEELMKDYRGGYNLPTCDLVNIYNKIGYCPYAALEGTEITVSKLEELRQIKFAKEIFEEVQPPYSAEDVKSMLHEKFPAVPGLEAELRILESLKMPETGASFLEFAGEFAARKCKASVKNPSLKLQCGYYVGSKDSNWSGTLDRLLKANHMPVLIFNEKPIYTNLVEMPDYAPHAVSVDGRRWNKSRQRCEYRISNSIGLPDCKYYGKSVTCDPSEVLSGHVWIDGSMIEQSSLNIALIQKLTNGHRKRSLRECQWVAQNRRILCIVLLLNRAGHAA